MAPLYQPVPLEHSYWVLPKLFLAGEHPGSRNRTYAIEALSALRDAGIRTWIDLTEEAEWFPYPDLLRELAEPDQKLSQK